MNEQAPSLELSEVSRRFGESERLLREARERLSSILESETRSQGLADTLSESAHAVAEFSSRAEAILRETEAAVHEARVVLKAGSDVISGNTLDEVSVRVSTVHERILQLTTSQAEILNAINADVEARQTADESAEGHLRALREQVADLHGRAVGNRTLLLVAAGVLLASQVVVLVAAVLT